VGQNPIDDGLVLDAAVRRIDDNPHRTTAAAANLDVDAEHTFQALSPGHRSVAAGGAAIRWRVYFIIGYALHTFAAFGWSDQPTPTVIRGKNAMVSREIDPGFRHEGSQSRNEIHGIECHLCRPIPVRRLQGVNHFAGGTL
jgi:hypothetical protein